MRHIFLLKPVDDDYDHHPFIETIREVMQGYDYDIFMSTYPDHAKKIIKHYKEPTRFYSVGGDGMLNQVIQGLVGTPHELVVIPYETGNDFFKMISKNNNSKEVLKASLKGKTIPIDTVLMNNRYFINNACFGCDSVIANHVHDDVKIPKMFKGHQYEYSILRNFVQYPFYHIKMTSHGTLLYEGPVTLCACANAKYYGGAYKIAPHASLDDGLMNIVILDQIKKGLIPLYIKKIVSETLDQDKHAHVFTVDEVDVESQYPCNLDGEEVKASHYHLEVKKNSLNLVVFDN